MKLASGVWGQPPISNDTLYVAEGLLRPDFIGTRNDKSILNIVQSGRQNLHGDGITAAQ